MSTQQTTDNGITAGPGDDTDPTRDDDERLAGAGEDREPDHPEPDPAKDRGDPENEPSNAETPVAEEAVPTAAASSSDGPEKRVDRPKSRRGFAAMDPALVREIASKGGKAAHAAGTAHEFNSEEARLAGRKGGQAAHRHHANNR